MENPPDLAAVEVDYFEPLLNEKFAAQAWEGVDLAPVELELVQATPHPLSARDGMRIPFSLLFKGPPGVPLGQSTYALTHPQTGEMPLLLVPVARKEERIMLQAVFN